MTEKDLPPVEAEARPKPKRWWHRFKPTLSVSAFIMSLTITLISAFNSIRGSEIVVLPPEQVLLYRDGEGDNAVLSIAMRLDMINNASSAYGDVMLDAQVQPRDGGPTFKYSTLVRPVFTDKSGNGECAFGSRCLTMPGLFLIENPDEIVDLPGGGAKVVFLSFPVATWNCKGRAAECGTYGTFDQALKALGSRPLNMKVTLRFHQDGQRKIECGGEPLNDRYLQQAGWLAAPCRKSSVSGAPLI